MKELSIEEKAKVYDEALKKARQLCAYPTTKPFINDLQDLFPELQEPEDERIKKTLIKFFSKGAEYDSSTNGIKDRNIIAWLEKQGEQEVNEPDWCHHKVDLSDCSEEYRKAYYDGWNNCNQQHSQCNAGQKPADKVESKFKVKYAGSEYNVLKVKDIAGVTFYGIEDEPNHIDYVLTENCERVGGYAIKENGSPYPTKPAVFSEQKSSWSEDDENRINRLIAYFEDKESFTAEDDVVYANWLKSLKERCTWKPSNEQIDVIESLIENRSFQRRHLVSLYEQLKKLKEK